MEFKEYVERLNKMLEDNPALAHASIFYSIDEEEYDVRRVENYPTTGYYDDGDFRDEYHIGGIKIINAVCVN